VAAFDNVCATVKNWYETNIYALTYLENGSQWHFWNTL